MPKYYKTRTRETGKSGLCKKILIALQNNFGGYWRKIHGGPMQSRGIPDIIGCCRGLFFGFEVKVPGKEDELSEYQQLNIDEIVGEGKGTASMVTGVREALDIVRNKLKERGKENVKHIVKLRKR